MGRQRRKTRRERIGSNIESRCGLSLTHLPLPFGTCVDLNHYTRILLYNNDENLDDEWHKVCEQINRLDSDMRIFKHLEQCIAYIKEKYVEKLYLVVFNNNKINIKDLEKMIIDACPSGQLTHVYILKGRKVHIGDEEMIINGAFDNDNDTNLNLQDDPHSNFVPMATYGLTHGHDTSIRDLTVGQVSFIWFQLLLDVLLRFSRKPSDMNDMLEVARVHYNTDPVEMNKINEFAQTYQPNKAIWWYTNDSFVYRLLNRALRTQDIRIIFTFRFFIFDLYTQLKEEGKKVASSLPKLTHRGQFLPMDELQMIKDNIGGLISMNTFSSTTTDLSVAFVYGGYGSRLPSHASVIFEIDLEGDHKNSSFERPFAPIGKHSSKRDEKEILFSMGTILRIISVEEYDETWLISLKLETEVKKCLSELYSYLRTDARHPIINEITLGDFLLDMGELHQAQQFYGLMLQQEPLEEEEKALLYNSIGLLHIDRGDYRAAEILFDQAYVVARNDPLLLSTTLNNRGLVDLDQGRYNRALKFFQRAKKNIRSTKRLANIYSNISSAFLGKGQLKKARRYSRRQLSLSEKHLPALHFDLANSYNNLAVVELNMGNYQKSIKLFEKCLTIYNESLPQNHHRKAHVLNNLGLAYSHLEEYSRAREYFEQALKIQYTTFEQTKDQHLLIAQSLNNQATLQFEQNDFSAAESSFQRVLEIKLAIPGLESSSHPSIANAYNNLAMVQLKQSRFKEALTNLKRTLSIELRIGNTGSIATTYNNIAGVYHEQNNFIKAKRFYRKALRNANIAFPENHPSIELYKTNLRKAEQKIRENKTKI